MAVVVDATLARSRLTTSAARARPRCAVRRYVRRFAHGYQPRDRSGPPRARPPGAAALWGRG